MISILLISQTLHAEASALLKPALLPLIGFRVNEGNPYTNKRKINVEIKSLKLSDSLIADMKIGLDPTLENTPWIKYSNAPVEVELTEGDGEKFIYARLRDIAGNISPVEATRIYLDTQPPQFVILSINKGEDYTKDPKGRVLVYIDTNEEDIAEMIFSNRRDFGETVWEKYDKIKRWILELSGGDGTKTVFARFKDRAGNISQIFEDDIILDTQPPVNGSIVINNDDTYTREQAVKLRVHAREAAMVRVVSPGRSEVFEYKEKEGQPFMEINWRLDSIEGTKVIRVFFMDEARNRTTNIIQDEIILDRTGPPSPFLSINGDSRYTNHKDGLVTLRLTTRVNPETIRMVISNFMNFHDADVQNFTDEINNWKLLAEEDGMKTIYAKYIDDAGNHSEISMSKIILDRVPPTINKVFVNDGGKWVTSTKVTINMDVSDASHMQINNTTAIANMVMWEPFSPKKVDWNIIPGDGEKIIYMRFKDPANNITDVASTEITLDTKPPTGEFTINAGDKFTNDPDKLVNLFITTTDGKGMQITNNPDFTDVKLEPVRDSVMNWQLIGEDGMKTIFVRLRDEAGNYSSVLTSSIVLDRYPPSDLGLVINEGQEWVRNPARRASVQLNARGASHYKLGETPDLDKQKWEVYKNVTTWIFSEQEGEKSLYAFFKDPAGNVSNLIKATIMLDYTPPICEEFTIDNGADFTNNQQKKVTLTIKAPDALKMAISNTPISDPTDVSTQWEDYVIEKEWVLEGEDGLKTIYIIFRDEAGNFSGRYNDRIIVDRVGPTECSVVINENNKYVPPGDRKFPVALSAQGADKIIIAENPEFSDGRWELFVSKKIYEVSAGDGIKNIYIKFRDKALNESEVFSGSVILDTKPPEAINLTINDGIMYTNDNSKTVTLDIEAQEASEMRIIQKGHPPGNWEVFSATKTYILLGEDGEKEIGVFLRDEAGNTTRPLVGNIILDRIPPKPVSLIIDDGRGWTNSTEKKVTLNIKAEGASEMLISTSPSLKDAEWEDYRSTVPDYILPGEDGEKIIFIKFRDEADNISPTISAKVNLKRTF